MFEKKLLLVTAFVKLDRGAGMIFRCLKEVGGITSNISEKKLLLRALYTFYGT